MCFSFSVCKAVSFFLRFFVCFLGCLLLALFSQVVGLVFTAFLGLLKVDCLCSALFSFDGKF